MSKEGRIEFQLTEDHIKLLRQMEVGWQRDEFGAPEIDPKRPYGNSQVYYDIAEHLGRDIPEEPKEFSDEEKAEMFKLHRETETALQIVLRTGNFAPGVYVADRYMQDWKLKG